MTDRPADASPGEQLVAQGAQVMRIENDTMTSIALARPRDEAAVKAKALALLDGDAEAASAAYYSIPFKDHHRNRGGDSGCTGKSDDDCPVKEEVEGVGIDGARELARLWGNNASRVYFADEDDDWVRVSAVFLDLETNVRTEVPFGIGKIATYASGDAYVLSPQRLAMAIQAGVSKCARNAIVQALPSHIVRAYYHKAKEVLSGSDSIDVDKLVGAFSAYDVTRATLESFYGSKLEDLDSDKRRSLRGLYGAIRDGHVKPAEYFAAAGGSGGGGRGDAKRGADAPAEQASDQADAPADATAGASAQVTGGHTREETPPSSEPDGVSSPITDDDAPPPEPEAQNLGF